MTGDDATAIGKWFAAGVGAAIFLYELAAVLWLPGMPTLSRIYKAWVETSMGGPLVTHSTVFVAGMLAGHLIWYQRARP